MLRRFLALILLLGFVAGCASTLDVPLPATTPYDRNAKARKGYLEAYRMGYKDGLSGGHGAADSFGRDQISSARNLGWFDGQNAGVAAADAQYQKEAQKETILK